MPKKADIAAVVANTIKVSLVASCRVGQLTFLSSATVSLKYRTTAFSLRRFALDPAFGLLLAVFVTPLAPV